MSKNNSVITEKPAKACHGMSVLIVNTLLLIGAVVGFVFAVIDLENNGSSFLSIAITIITALYFGGIGPLLYVGLKAIKPNEALVMTLFGRYIGTLKKEGFYFVNPFVVGVNPTITSDRPIASTSEKPTGISRYTLNTSSFEKVNKKLSLKAMTLNNEKQKVNDSLGNPVIIGIVVIWKIVDTAKAVFNVDNYIEYVSIQADAALRNIVRLFPYDAPEDETELTLRGSSNEVAIQLQQEIQEKCKIAGIEILEARITHLSYAPEIASAMLQRQQATAIIAARQKIVEGAVGMVEMALAQLNEKQIVDLDEERKAQMVSNMLVVLSGNRDAQPIVNAGSIY